MNERIRELAEQAGFGLHSDGEIYTAKLEHLPITENMEKFAELIVRECIEIVQPESYDGDAMTASLNAKVKQIKQRFGVE